jgi:hypothetical protein
MTLSIIALYTVVQSVVMLSAANNPNVLSVLILCDVMLNVNILRYVMLSVIMLCGLMLNVIILGVLETIL